ncbi:MAG: NAD(P)/FAD-dependent oxidoreductase [bacterium]
MLKDGEKGAVLQADRETYGIAPSFACGELTPELLRKLADVSEKYGAQSIKITSANRIALLGLKEEDLDRVWSELGLEAGPLVGMCVRSVRCCVGNTYCRLGQRDSMGLGRKLHDMYTGMELPNKLKIAVSGCPINCAEGWVRDIGLFAQSKKWTVVVGGNIGSRPRLAQELARDLETDEQALKVVERVIGFYKETEERGRLGRIIEKIGMGPLREAIGKSV